MPTSGQSAADTMESSRLEVMECEKEIQSIKNSLKSLNLGAAESGDKLNSLKVSVHKLKLRAESEHPSCTFKVHLSSPIEERSIVKMHDPLDPDAEGSFALFESVETSNALLTIEAFSGNEESEKIGVSAAHDLLPLVEDMTIVSGDDGKKSLMVDFAIVTDNGNEIQVDSKNDDNLGGEVEKQSEQKSEPEAGDELALDNDDAVKAQEENNDIEESGDSTQEGDGPAQDAKVTKELKVQVPVCTLSVHLEYSPSLNDKRDALYDQLNEVSKRKAAAIELLRKSATAVNRAKMEEASASDEKQNTVVKSGFLNKAKAGKTAAPPSFLKRCYDKTIGPKSMLWVVGPIAKNYVIFFAVSAFFHYKGDLLAIPPPV